MTRQGERLAWFGGAVALLGVAIGGTYFLTRPAAAATTPSSNGGGGTKPPPPPPTNATQLLPGHRYKLVATDPAVAAIPPADVVKRVRLGFDGLFGAGNIVIVSTNVVGDTLTLVFDYKGAAAVPVSLGILQVKDGSLVDLGQVSNPGGIAMQTPQLRLANVNRIMRGV